MPTYVAQRGGYTLAEMAIVLAIMGTVGGAVLTLGSAQHETAKAAITAERLDAIEAAIRRQGFSAGYLPCPADPTALPGAAGYGASVDCTSAKPASIEDAGTTGGDQVWIGAVPTRTLNLPDSAMYDGWQNRFTYAVVRNLAKDAETFAAYSTTLDTGVIQILDASGNQVTDAENDTVVAYAVISHGKNRKGAITRAATIPVPCGAAVTLDDENCDYTADAVFVDTRMQESTTAADYYDDIVRWKSSNYLLPVDGGALAETCTDLDAITTRLALDSDGRLFMWGDNASGQLGDGNQPTGTTTTAVQVSGNNADWFMAMGEGSFTCGLRGTNGVGSAYCWGDNTYGQLGDNSNTASDTPVAVDGGYADWSALDVDAEHACALRAGRIYCWGRGASGRLGNGGTANQDVPTEISGSNSDWTAIDTGDTHSCGIRSGLAYCWGDNASGQLGDNTTAAKNIPTLVVGGFTDWEKLGIESNTTCGIRATGAAYCWGENGNTQVGDAATTDRTTPTIIPGGFTDWSAIHGGGDFSCGIRSGHLYCWGNRVTGGIPDTGAWVGDQTTPQEESGGNSNWVSVHGYCGTRSNGTYYCWGPNGTGQVGDGSMLDRTSPSPVAHAQPGLCQ